MTHKTVLLNEAINGLDIHPGDVLVDCTLGSGGHSEEVCKRFGNTVSILGIDEDSAAISRTKSRLHDMKCNIQYVQGNFASIGQILLTLRVSKVDKILMDIGLSSNQFEESGRGFSFQRDEPLLMTFKESLIEGDLTAREIVNNWDEENIATILWGYGQERFSRKIAKAIVERRKVKPIETTFELVKIIKGSTPSSYHHRKIHPATKTFQALRITVNNELKNLKKGLSSGFNILNTKGRLAVISFHSLEDRIVKQFMKEREEKGEGKRITKKPIIPSDEEISENPRSRSAKLRILLKN